METNNSFNITSPLLIKLRLLVVRAALFFIAGFFGILISSQISLRGLSNVNAANESMKLSIQLIGSFNASMEQILKVVETGNVLDNRFTFNSAQKIAKEILKKALLSAKEAPQALISLQKTDHDLDEFTKAGLALFEKVENLPHPLLSNRIQPEFLIVKALELDVREDVRVAQLEIDKYSDASFENAYQKRYLPLISAIVFTLLSLLYIGFVGIPITNKFKFGINNLSRATESVAQGNLEVQAEVLDQDEIGKLTHDFNQMVLSIKESRDQLTQAVRIRDDFILIASHELRTPLTPLKMQLYTLTKHIRESENVLPKGKELASIINSSDRQVNRLIQLAENLLDVSRLSRGLLVLNRETIDLSELVLEIIKRYQTESEKAHCEIELDLQPGIKGSWDLLRIEQSIINLLTNALKYGSGKPILIRTLAFDHRAQFIIQDHGIGIAKKDISKLFERFERAAPLTSYGGLGLGLFITRQIIEAHGGTIKVESNLGAGSTFTFELPLEIAKAQIA